MQLDNIFELIKQSAQLPFSKFVEDLRINSIGGSSVDYSDMYRKGFVFQQFQSLNTAFESIENIRLKPVREQYEDYALNNVSSSQFNDFKAYKEFLNKPNKQLDDIKSLSNVFVDNVKTLINLGGLYANDKIVITEDARGIFDFGLASLGLYRPVEFYSKELSDDIIDNKVNNPYAFNDTELGVVNPQDVDNSIIGGIKFYIFDYLGKKYSCERRQKGATKVFNSFPDECFLKPNSDGILITYYLNNHNKVFNGVGNIRLKYASSNKKSYLIYNKKDESVKNVDIFMPVNFLTSSVSDGGRAIALLPAYLIASALEEFGIQTRISAMRLGSDNNTNISVSVPVKDYNESSKESFDRIFILLANSDSADTLFGFLKIIAENEGIQADATGSVSTGFQTINYFRQDYIDDMMQRYKNWSEINKDKPFFNSKVSNPNFQFGIKTVSDLEVDLTYKNMLQYIHQIFFDFYYYMDFLAIEMLSMDVYVKSIYKRITEDETFRKLYEVPTTKNELKELIRSYTLTMLVRKYSVVKKGAYSDTKEQVIDKETKFKDKVTLLNEALNIL